MLTRLYMMHGWMRRHAREGNVTNKLYVIKESDMSRQDGGKYKSGSSRSVDEVRGVWQVDKGSSSLFLDKGGAVFKAYDKFIIPDDEITTYQSESSNSSASATITITMYTGDEE